jgi:tripartite-type tricarboxylate transporter receptor subunit TctC
MKLPGYRSNIALFATSLLVMLAASGAHAQERPTKQMIRIVSPSTPGGTTDVLARMLDQKMQETLGQTVVVENRGGASRPTL